MPVNGGVNLGNATGRITIDYSDLNNVRVVSQQTGVQVEKNLARMGTGAKKAQDSFDSMSGSLNQLAGAFGVSLGVGAVAQMGRFVVEADKLATSYKRQSIAAVNLAGGQGKLNDLLRTYETATGGAVDKATSLANVTKLMAVGFADNAPELDKFATAIRGISIAMGQSQDTVTQNLILELFTQRGMRLDQLGLQYDKVKARADALAAADRTLTTQMAYQAAVLEQAEERFGALADSAEGQKTGLERLAVAWSNLQLVIGQTGQSTGTVGGFFDFWATGLERVGDAIGQFDEKFQRSIWRAQGLNPDIMQAGMDQMAADNARNSRRVGGGGAPPPRFSDEQIKIAREHNETIEEIERDSNNSRLESIRSYNEQVSSTERNYQQTVSREAQDFATSRLRQEADFADSILDIRRDAGRREADQAEDLARTIARSERDSAERIADAREDTAERLADLDENFKRDQEKREEDFKDDMLSAAGRLDAIELLELRKGRAKDIQEAKEAHEEQRRDLEEQLQERIDDENEALAKSIANAQEAHNRQLEDAREADELRIADMKADFEERKVLEDADRALRLARMAEDRQNQLNEMARQHALDLQQIATNEAENRAQEQKEFEAALAEEGIRNNRWIAEDRRRTDAAIAHLEEISLAISRIGMPIQGPANRIPLPSFAPTPYNPVPGWQRSATGATTNNRTTNFTAGSIVVYGAPGQSPFDLAAEVREQVILLLEGAN